VLDVVFWIMAVAAIGSALAVVLLRNAFRAALSLILLFLVIAGIYVTLSADFLAVVQILVYVGAISILIIVGVMLTRDVTHGNPSGRLGIPGIIVGILLLGVLVFTLATNSWDISTAAPLTPTAGYLGQDLFGEGGYLLPVEIIAILLLTAIMGAIVLIGDSSGNGRENSSRSKSRDK
jgi:NADH:ubiquinone oxidoreductase subunit 6 (subunit J)